MTFPFALPFAIAAAVLVLPLPVAAVAQTQAISPAPVAGPAPVDPPAKTILFVGNSFTFGAGSAAMRYKVDSVTDLNGDGIGGVPAIFKQFTQQAGLNYEVSLETSPGKSLEWHWTNKRDVIDRRWDYVVLQDYSTLDPKNPGNPAKLIDYSGRLASLFEARNGRVDVSLTATWSRADQTYKQGGAWYGKPIYQMAIDLARGYAEADKKHKNIDRVNPVGLAFNCAMEAGFADFNPYDGISFDQVDLWTHDQYHASTAGYYLEALTVFAGVTGKDPRSLGRGERAASDLGLSSDQAERLQKVAWAATQGQACRDLAKR